jgi:DNA-binding NarL/FixJ family response regulator
MNRREYDTRGCAFNRVLNRPDLDNEDRQAIHHLLETGPGHHAIATALQDAGINISTKTVERHRRNICTCKKTATWAA